MDLDIELVATLGYATVMPSTTTAQETLGFYKISPSQMRDHHGEGPGALWLKGQHAKALALAERQLQERLQEAAEKTQVKRGRKPQRRLPSTYVRPAEKIFEYRGATGTAAELAKQFGVKPDVVRNAAWREKKKLLTAGKTSNR